MRAFLFVFAVILAVGLLFTINGPDAGKRVAPHPATQAATATPVATPAAISAIADYPDRGELVVGDDTRQVVRVGASTWHPVQISEAHALRAIADGAMTVQAPNGETLRLNYERHVEHPDGNWSWIGREEGSAPGTESVLTFGEKAVFGTIRQGNSDLKVTTEAGSTWLVETDASRSAGSKVAANDDDFLIAGAIAKAKASAAEPMPAANALVGQEPGTQAVTAAAAAPAVVDIAMGFTTGFASRLGGDSQARTRLNFLIDLTNQALTASGINAQIRLVHALQVDYPDATPSRTALFDLTGVDCTTATNGSQYLSDRRVNCTPITQPAGLVPLTQARNTFGADVLVLVRKFEDPEQVSCGSAWMLGGGQNTLDASSAPYAMTVISDSSGELFPDNGNTCHELQLAHEIGHNFGQQHDVVTASGTDDSDGNGSLLDPEEFGRHPYSFGYSTDGTAADISTIMSNRRPTQTRFRVYANPLITCGTQPCGDAATADNARSMAQTIPAVALFRATVVPPAARPFAGLYSIHTMGASGFTDMHVLTGESGYQTFSLHTPTSLGQAGTSNLWAFALNDLNRDGVPDLYCIYRMGASGHTELYVLDGANNYRSALLQIATVLPPTGTGLEWVFRLGDYNRDGVADLYTLYRIGASGKTELHVVDGATNFQTYLAHIATGLGQTGTTNAWQFELADRNGDGVLDLYCINRAGLQNTEVHVLDGAGGFQTPLLQIGTALAPVGTGNEWDFKLADYDRDGVTDLYTIYRIGASGKTELHILDGRSNFSQFSAHIATGVPATGTDTAWKFELWPQ
jgi:hypothetical protein